MRALNKCSEIDDCDQPWTFEPNSLDYVHLRHMAGSIKDWFGLFEEAFRCTKPGGYIESFDTSGGFDRDQANYRLDCYASDINQWIEENPECEQLVIDRLKLHLKKIRDITRK